MIFTGFILITGMLVLFAYISGNAPQAIVYAGFTTVYAILISFFLFYPVYALHKGE